MRPQLLVSSFFACVLMHTLRCVAVAGRLESLLRRMATSLEACCEVTNNNAARLSNLEAANPNPNPIAAPLRTHVLA